MTTYTNDSFDLNTVHGWLEYVQCEFEYAWTMNPPEPDVGLINHYWEITEGPKIQWMAVGSKKLTRTDLICMAGEEEVKRIEEAAESQIGSLLDAGELNAPM